jgi:cytochrome c oxidase subunit 2
VHSNTPRFARGSTLSRIVVALLVVGAAAWTSGAVSGQDATREIDVVARRYAFEPSRIEVTVGERVRLRVVSADGVHGLEIKKFRVNKEIPRGTKPVVIEFTATEAGQFPILCSEYCGDGHEDMKGQLVVLTREGQTTEAKPNANE